MTISTFGPFPAQLQNAIQQNFLERAFMEALHNILAYREIPDKEVFQHVLVIRLLKPALV